MDPTSSNLSDLVREWTSVFVSQGYHNKSPRMRWLKTTEIYCVTVLGVRSLKSGCWQDCIPSEGPREKPSLLFLISSNLHCSLSLQLHHSNLYCHCHMASLQGHQLLDLGPTPIQYKLLKLPNDSCQHLISHSQALGRIAMGSRSVGDMK